MHFQVKENKAYVRKLVHKGQTVQWLKVFFSLCLSYLPADKSFPLGRSPWSILSEPHHQRKNLIEEMVLILYLNRSVTHV